MKIHTIHNPFNLETAAILRPDSIAIVVLKFWISKQYYTNCINIKKKIYIYIIFLITFAILIIFSKALVLFFND